MSSDSVVLPRFIRSITCSTFGARASGIAPDIGSDGESDRSTEPNRQYDRHPHYITFISTTVVFIYRFIDISIKITHNDDIFIGKHVTDLVIKPLDFFNDIMETLKPPY